MLSETSKFLYLFSGDYSKWSCGSKNFNVAENNPTVLCFFLSVRINCLDSLHIIDQFLLQKEFTCEGNISLRTFFLNQIVQILMKLRVNDFQLSGCSFHGLVIVMIVVFLFCLREEVRSSGILWSYMFIKSYFCVGIFCIKYNLFLSFV